MIDDALKEEMLRTIALRGSLDDNAIKPIISKESPSLLRLSAGIPRIKASLIGKFKLILSQPLALQALNPFEVRCSLCRKVISYPCWYYEERFAVNWFHYFVCFDSSSNTKVTARCFRR